ncbi:MAG TPA: glycosyltransferase [Polyangiaceae bacterium]|nr:glycosyltransferase [Polyangiaceae bacterium]
MSAVLVVYFAVLLLLCTYGVHRAHMVWLWLRHRKTVQAAADAHTLPSELPIVTVQLPLYNEATVAERLLDAAAAFDYPRDRLEIQVLDDSTDETRMIVSRKVQALQRQGLDIQHIRRTDRVGYKAGALDYGLKLCKGEFVAMFDADFIPGADFILRVIGHFTDPTVAVVQTRWAHLNRDAAFHTHVQALLLDGHHVVENQARFGSGRLFNFSGTGGIWRRAAIDDAGGWQHDTLTEDLDLSYRAQLKGWKFIYRPDVVTHAELPEEMSALRAQQYRWAKGTVQTARKLLGTVLSAKQLTFSQRLEAFFHLTPHAAYPLMLLLTVLVLPALLVVPAADIKTMALIDLPLCLGATGSLGAFLALAERGQGRPAGGAIMRLPLVIALGAGLSPLVTRAVIGGLREMAGEFVRTPKRGSNGSRYHGRARLPWTELVLCAISVCSVIASIQTGHWFATPFTLMFAAGYAYVATQLVLEQLATRHEVPRLVTAE